MNYAVFFILYNVIHYSVLYCILLYCTVLYSTVLCRTVQRCTLTFYYYISFAFKLNIWRLSFFLVFSQISFLFVNLFLQKWSCNTFFGKKLIFLNVFFWKLRKLFTKPWWWTLFMVFISLCIFSFVENCCKDI